MMSKGIIVAGNMIVDVLYPVAGWPKQGELVHIHDGITRTTGGAVCNVISDLARLDPDLPLYAVGKNGSDAEGDVVMARFAEHPNIDVSGIVREGISAFTAVMQDVNTGARTFFTYPGANGQFDENCIDWDGLRGDIFHIGYILLLNALDAPDEEYGTKMARLLHRVQQKGIRTSVDVVSEASDRFRRLVIPALKYADYCVINEIEAQETTGVMLRDKDGALHPENMSAALCELRRMGVSTWVVIHAPEGAWGLDEEGNLVAKSSLNLPEDYIKGTVGAGDAFCAGVLYGAETGCSLAEAIDIGTAAAAASLSQPDSVSGVRTVAENMRLFEKYGT